MVKQEKACCVFCSYRVQVIDIAAKFSKFQLVLQTYCQDLALFGECTLLCSVKSVFNEDFCAVGVHAQSRRSRKGIPKDALTDTDRNVTTCSLVYPLIENLPIQTPGSGDMIQVPQSRQIQG